MSEQQPKSPSFFRKIVGLFFNLGDEQSAPQKKNPVKAPVSGNPATPANTDQHPTSQTVRHPEVSEPHDLAPVAKETAGNAPVEKAPAPEMPESDIPAAFPFPEAPQTGSTATHSDLDTPIAVPETQTAKIQADEHEKLHISMPVAPPSAMPASKLKPIVTFSNVTKIFNPGTANEFMALKNITFEIEDLPDVGEFIALVGPSGCGKSTVLNLIQGFQEVGPPTLGEVLVRGKPVTGPGRDRGMIFQKYSSFPHLTVLQNVMFGLQLNRESLGYPEQVMEKLAREMIAKVGMKGHEDKYPYQLSGGQQQRVAIARTLVLKPRIILMDEPFSALDEPTRIEMQELITALWHEVEATVFIVTHSLAEAVYLSDRIFMFQANPGRLARQIAITRDLIGKYEGMTPLEVQESPKFNGFLKEITDEFLKIGGSD